MARRYFGTDGIRGLANSAPMTSETALRVGMVTLASLHAPAVAATALRG